MKPNIRSKTPAYLQTQLRHLPAEIGRYRASPARGGRAGGVDAARGWQGVAAQGWVAA